MNKSEAFDFLKRLADGVSVMFGSTCETLIHDMSVPNHPIIYISNGHVSNRKIGSTEDIYGDIGIDEDAFLDKDFINHLVLGKSGRRLKSSTFHFKGKDYHYAFGINFDFTYMYEYQKQSSEFMNVSTELYQAINENKENTLDSIFDGCIDTIGKSTDRLGKTDRLRVISMLMEQGVFNYHKSVPYIAKRLGVSRNTIYKYMKEVD